MHEEDAYLLLTPGPLTTSPSVKQVMLQDYCTWDDDYREVVSEVRSRLCKIAGGGPDVTSVLMQGGGTFAVESAVGSCIPAGGKLLVLENGAYGRRVGDIASRLQIPHTMLRFSETEPVDPQQVQQELASDSQLSHVIVVHCETTTGLLNPAAEIGELCRQFRKTYIVDAMSSFGGIAFTMDELNADYLISSANKCLQGVPGFAFVIARRALLEETAGWARSLSLDLYDQWREMEEKPGKWRYTSPTHAVRAFLQALRELDEEGGVPARAARYRENHRILVAGLSDLAYSTLIAPEHQSPIITSFRYPSDVRFSFPAFYKALKTRGFVIYPEKIGQADTFRIGNIGHVFPDDIRLVVAAIADVTQQLHLTC